ncbi:LamG-like jellyroll fold domain-containing protein, partial [Streptomyces chromofuscus]
VVKRENDLGQHIYLWEFARTAVGPDGTVTQSTVVPATYEAQVGTRVTLTGVFNAQADPETGDGDLDLYVGQEPQLQEVGTFPTPQQGSGELSWGRGTAAGSTGHYFTGALEQLRVWSGAMTVDQIRSQVLAPGITG